MKNSNIDNTKEWKERKKKRLKNHKIKKEKLNLQALTIIPYRQSYMINYDENDDERKWRGRQQMRKE